MRKKWCRARKRWNTHDDDRIGRPRTSRTDVKATRVERVIFESRRVKIRDLSNALELSVGSVHNTVHKEVKYHRVHERSRYLPQRKI